MIYKAAGTIIRPTKKKKKKQVHYDIIFMLRVPGALHILLNKTKILSKNYYTGKTFYFSFSKSYLLIGGVWYKENKAFFIIIDYKVIKSFSPK